MPPPIVQIDNLHKDMEIPWPDEVRSGLDRSMSDLADREIVAWDACREYTLIYYDGKLVGGTDDTLEFMNKLGEQFPQGVWFEPVGVSLRSTPT